MLAAIFTLIAYMRFRSAVEAKIEEWNEELNGLETVENDLGGIDPSPQTLRRTSHGLVHVALRSALPSWIAYLAIWFAFLSGVLGLLSVFAT